MAKALAPSAGQVIQNNLMMRGALLQSAPRNRKDLGSYTGTQGSNIRVKLANVGITTGLQLVVTMPITIATAAALASWKAPWNLLNRVRVTDYDGTDRVNCSGFQLYLLNSVRNRFPYGYNNEGPLGTPATGGVNKVGVTPTAVGAQTVQFIIDVPFAYDANADLRGAILSQTAIGEMYLSLDINSAIAAATGDDDNVYRGNATTVFTPGAVTVQVYQNYLLPQAIGGMMPLPQLDLLTVYEIAGNNKSTDNLSVGAEKLLNYPNARTVIGYYLSYLNGGNLDTGTISKFRLIANGNNVLQEHSQLTKQFEQRLYCEGDVAYGSYFFLHRDRPIETQLYGNVQLGVTPAVVSGGNTYIETMVESFFTKGAMLPGMQQQ